MLMISTVTLQISVLTDGENHLLSPKWLTWKMNCKVDMSCLGIIILFVEVNCCSSTVFSDHGTE